jgi:K(+)-stimulated pyrophosphate-energized sodium pump
MTTRALLALSPGNERMQSISLAVQQGARAYLNRQYTTIAVVGVALFVALIFIQNIAVAGGFAIGGLLSGSTGYIGMNVSVRSNARVAEAARGGVTPALRVAFRGGAITGLLVVGLALIGVAGYYGALTSFFGDSPKTAVDALIGLGFGGSLISVFARLGGGIFTKAADVGADLVGKVEAGIPEDDPRNPATIADNVGDNVGDCAGMAADLFETYAVTAVAVILLGVLTFNEVTRVALYPLVIGGVAIIASIIGTFAVRTSSGNVERALLQGLIVSGVIAAAAFAPITYWLMRDLTFQGVSLNAAPSWSHLYLCSLIGIAVTALLFGLTEYYTSTRFSPVKKTAKASITGHATNIIQGFGSGLQATALPAIVIVLGILGAWKLGGGGVTGIYGIGVAVMGLLSLTGLIVALDAFGPITDNAGGIAEMADLPEEVRKVTDRLDAVGNTTKAVTKGYAIGSAVLAAIVLFAGFQKELETNVGHAISFGINEPPVLIGLLIGGLMVCLFASLSIEAVGRAGGAVVEEVRRQFREHPGIMEGTEDPDYATCVDIVTKTARDDSAIAASDRADPDRRLDRHAGARWAADRRDRRGLLLRCADDRRRWRLGQREEADRGRRVRGQGLRRARGVGHWRYGRRSLQGHGGPRDQPDDQGRQHRCDPDHPPDHLSEEALSSA